jgi:hypothetical protein
MDVLKELADTIRKMFAADLALSLIVLAVAGAVAGALRANLIGGTTAPALLAAGVLAALIVGVARGCGRS